MHIYRPVHAFSSLVAHILPLRGKMVAKAGVTGLQPLSLLNNCIKLLCKIILFNFKSGKILISGWLKASSQWVIWVLASFWVGSGSRPVRFHARPKPAVLRIGLWCLAGICSLSHLRATEVSWPMSSKLGSNVRLFDTFKTALFLF